MSREGLDVVVIGGGPAGYTAAIRAAQHDLRVLLVERSDLGGTCLNRGCIPSKALIHCAKVWRTVQLAHQCGVKVDNPQLDWDAMQGWVTRVVQTLRRGLQTLLMHHGVAVTKGEASFVNVREILVETPTGSETVTASTIVVATGSRPLPLPYEEGAPVVTEEEALFLPQLPCELIIVGGGASGVELAWLFSTLGVKVTLVEMLPRLLPSMDEEIALGLQQQLERQGVTVRLATKVTRIATQNGRAAVHTETGEGWVADLVVLAVGRRANSENLANLGIPLKPNGAVEVNEWQQTLVPSIFAIGDVTHGSGTAHGGMAEAERAVKGIVKFLAGEPLPPQAPDFVVPLCVYTEPQALKVGLTEQEAQERDLAIKVARFPWRASGAAMATGETDGFVKVIAEAKSMRVLGLHILGADAVNLSGEAAFIVAHGLTVEQATAIIRPHPSLSEGIGEALWALAGMPLHIAKRPERGRREWQSECSS